MTSPVPGEHAALVSFDAAIEEVVATLGYIPAALIGAIQERHRQFVDHHKRSVIKHAGQKFVAGDRARRMVASRLFRRLGHKNPAHLEGVTAESFAAGRDGGFGAITGKSLLAWEYGGAVGGGEWQAVPIGRGRPFAGVFQNRAVWTGKGYASALGDSSKFMVIKSPRTGKLIIIDVRKRTLQRQSAAGVSDPEVVGVLMRRRNVAAKLGFYDEANRVIPKHLAAMEKDAALALTEAGRASLDKRGKLLSAQRSAWRDTYRQYLDANPRKFGKARAVAGAARRAVRQVNFLGIGAHV